MYTFLRQAPSLFAQDAALSKPWALTSCKRQHNFLGDWKCNEREGFVAGIRLPHQCWLFLPPFPLIHIRQISSTEYRASSLSFFLGPSEFYQTRIEQKSDLPEISFSDAWEQKFRRVRFLPSPAPVYSTKEYMTSLFLL